jgi:hypothetical protein
VLLVRHAPLIAGACRNIIKVVERFELRSLVHLNVALDPVWDRFGELVVDEAARWHSEDIVKLFESALLRLWHEQEDEDSRGDVQTTIMK